MFKIINNESQDVIFIEGKTIKWQNQYVTYEKDGQIFFEKTNSHKINDITLHHLNKLNTSTYHLDGENLYKDNSLVFTFSPYNRICNISFLETSDWKTILDSYHAQREQDEFLAFFDKKVA